MKTADNDHLSERQFLQALVDAADLPAGASRHLSSCEACRHRLALRRRNLTAVGNMARRLAPSPPRYLPIVDMARAPRGWFVRWRAASGLALAGAVALLLIGGLFWARLDDNPGPRMANRPAWPSDPVMVETGMLTENALPRIFLDLTGESDPLLDDEFIRFVVPSEEIGPLSRGPYKKGIQS
jgi:hypothetical protein